LDIREKGDSLENVGTIAILPPKVRREIQEYPGKTVQPERMDYLDYLELEERTVVPDSRENGDREAEMVGQELTECQAKMASPASPDKKEKLEFRAYPEERETMEYQVCLAPTVSLVLRVSVV
jgi:hypothetical protein